MRKKLICLLLCLVAVVLPLAMTGCGNSDTTDGTDAQSTDDADTATDGQTPTDSTDYSYDSY